MNIYPNKKFYYGIMFHHVGKGLDNGHILYYAVSEPSINLFDYSMSTVKSSFFLKEKISN